MTNYKVKVDKHVFTYISRLGSKEREYFKERFDALSHNKTGYRLLDVHKNIELWELRCQSHRVYYTFENGFILIESVEYAGDVVVSRAGNKNTQKRDIQTMKHKMRV